MKDHQGHGAMNAEKPSAVPAFDAAGRVTPFNV